MTDLAQSVRDAVSQSRRSLPSSPELTRLEEAALCAAVVLGELGEALANSQSETEEVGQLNAVAEDALTDRIEALEWALVTAREAMNALEPLSLCRWCLQWTRPDQEQQHTPDCKRQQAIIDIAGVIGAEPCKHERWATEVSKQDFDADLGPLWLPKSTEGSFRHPETTSQHVSCARCGITADKVVL